MQDNIESIISFETDNILIKYDNFKDFKIQFIQTFDNFILDENILKKYQKYENTNTYKMIDLILNNITDNNITDNNILFIIGIYYNYKKNYQTSIKFYLLSKTPDAYCNIGYLYQIGRGVARNYETSMKFYLLSKTPEAYCNIGILYYYGKGIEQNYKQAMKYFLLSKTPNAYYNIGFLYKDGLGVEQDNKQSIKYFILSKKYINKGILNSL